jgi:hypothetical protein
MKLVIFVTILTRISNTAYWGEMFNCFVLIGGNNYPYCIQKKHIVKH